MGEVIKTTAKKPEGRRENSVSQSQKTDFSHSANSPVDRILFLQKTIGNQAVGRLIKSGNLPIKPKIDFQKNESGKDAPKEITLKDTSRKSVPEKSPERAFEPAHESSIIAETPPEVKKVTSDPKAPSIPSDAISALNQSLGPKPPGPLAVTSTTAPPTTTPAATAAGPTPAAGRDAAAPSSQIAKAPPAGAPPAPKATGPAANDAAGLETEASAAPHAATAAPAPGAKPAPSKSTDKEAKAPAEAEDGGVPEGGTPAGHAGPAVKLHIPEPPSGPSPATTRRIQGVQGRAGAKAASHGALPSGANQVGDARQAVTEPDAEAAAKAQAELIAQVQAAPSPEIVKLCERIREVIKNKRPPDQDALMEAKPEDEALNAGNQLNSTVEGETKKVQDNYGAMDNPPAPASPAKGQDLPPQLPPASTASVNAKAATPDAVPASDVSLDQDAADSKKKAQDAGMDTPASQLVQSGPIAEARAAQGELDQAAKEDPAKVLARQKEALGKAEGDMTALEAQALTALTTSRDSTTKVNASRQQGMVGSEESMRAKAGAEAKKAFDDAKTQVDALLEPLAANAMTEWEAAKELLVTQFKADLAIVQKRVEERHSGASGFVVGLWDVVTGLPAWAEDAYAKAEQNFGDGVIKKLTEISTKVNAVIATCDLIIKNARERITKIFSELPKSLQGWAEQERAKFDGQLDQLHNNVLAARDNFNKDLVERSSAAVDEVRTEIAELRKKAGGLVGRIVSAVNRFIEDPVKFIIEGLLELLGIPPASFWAVVAKIKKVVKDIADDPMKFANNLLKGLGQGFSQFFDNVLSHLLKGFLNWLTSGLGDVGVKLPKDLSLKSIITFFLQLMGITWPRIRKLLAKHVGEKNVALLEKVYSLVSFLIEKGPEGIFEMIKEKLDPQSIVDQVVQLAVDFLVSAVVKAVSARIILLFNPAGAILQALEAIYRVLKWIFQNAARIFTLIETVVNGIADILAGSTGGFANAIEMALGMLIAPVISFLADYLGFGDLPSKISEKIKSFQEWILGLIEKALVWIIEKGKALLAAVGIGKKEKDKKGARPEEEGVGQEIDFEANEEFHRLWIAVHGGSAKVMVASNKQTLSEYLSEVAEEAGTDPVAGPHIKAAQEILARLGPDADKLALLLAKRAAAPDEETSTAGGSDAEVAKEQEEVKSEEEQLVEHLKILFELLSSIKEIESMKKMAKSGWKIANKNKDIWDSWMKARVDAGMPSPHYLGKNFASTADGYTTFSGGLSDGFLYRIRNVKEEIEIYNRVVKSKEEKGTIRAIGNIQLEFSSDDESEHAEVKMSIKKPNEPFGVTARMCGGCQKEFEKLALQKPQVVDDGGEEPRVFKPKSEK